MSVDNNGSRGKSNDLTGQVFNRWTVLGLADPSKNGKRRWLCRCSCVAMTEKVVAECNLRSGHSKSCGCYNVEQAIATNMTHGEGAKRKQTTEYKTWSGMKNRCRSQTHDFWMHYGGRGITVCERWQNSFEAFIEDMGRKPSPQHTIDRKDNDGHYSCGKCDECVTNSWPANCRWLPHADQCNNRSTSRIITFEGKSLTLATWSRLTGIHHSTIDRRIRKGWAMARVLTEPSKVGRRKKQIAA